MLRSQDMMEEDVVFHVLQLLRVDGLVEGGYCRDEVHTSPMVRVGALEAFPLLQEAVF